VTAVSAGAVLRAHNIEQGPDRIIQSSYGFLRTEPYEPNVYSAHKEDKPWYDDVDGEYYLHTVVYFMTKVNKLSSSEPQNR